MALQYNIHRSGHC